MAVKHLALLVEDLRASGDTSGGLSIASGKYGIQLNTGSKLNLAAGGLEIDLTALNVSDLADGADYFKHDGSVTATGSFDMGSSQITNMAAPSGNQHATTKKYVDDLFVKQRIWKELLLTEDQLMSDSGSTGGGYQPAMIITLNALPTADDTIDLSDGTTTEAFVFKAAASSAREVTIGADIATAMTNLAAEINDDSVRWVATYWADAGDSFDADGVVVVTVANPDASGTVTLADSDTYSAAAKTGATAAGDSNTDRIWQATGNDLRIVDYFTNSDLDYRSQSLSTTPGTSDPMTAASGVFGPSRAVGTLLPNETHVDMIGDNIFVWDDDTNVWNRTSGAGNIGAGSGMTKSGDTLNVIGGDGITANADDIALDLHSTNPGLEIDSTQVRVKADASRGVSLDANGVGLDIHATNPGLEIDTAQLRVKADATRGISLDGNGTGILLDTDPGLEFDGSNGIRVKVPANNGIQVGATGVALTLDGATLSQGGSGVKVNEANAFTWTATHAFQGSTTRSTNATGVAEVPRLDQVPVLVFEQITSTATSTGATVDFIGTLTYSPIDTDRVMLYVNRSSHFSLSGLAAGVRDIDVTANDSVNWRGQQGGPGFDLVTAHIVIAAYEAWADSSGVHPDVA